MTKQQANDNAFRLSLVALQYLGNEKINEKQAKLFLKEFKQEFIRTCTTN